MTTEFGYGDIVAVVQPGVDGIILPKVETVDEIKAADWLVHQLERDSGLKAGSVDIIPIIETAKGVANVAAIAAAGTRVRRLSFGAGDFTLDMNIEWSRDEDELLPYRSAVVLASRAGGIEPPLDTVWVDIKDVEGFTKSVRTIKRLGFQGKMCIYPDQVPVVNEILAPSAADVGMGTPRGCRLQGGGEGGLRLHPARRQVHRLPDRLSRRAGAGDARAHLCQPPLTSPPASVRRFSNPGLFLVRSLIMSDGEAPSPHPTVKPLQGIRIIDVSSFLAGPFCSTQLAEFGAEVYQARAAGGRRCAAQVRHADAVRRLAPLDAGDAQQEGRHARPAQARGRRAAKRMIRKADVLVENFQPGTLEKWGLGWDTLKEENGKLIMVRISGFGQTGPYSPRPGFGRIGNAFGGLSYLAGFPELPPITPGSATIPDYMAGLYGALGVMFALRARDMTGRGQFIDIGLYEPIFRILDELAASYAYKGYHARAHGARHRQRLPAQPLPDQGRQVDRHRLHVGQDLRAPRRGAGPARARGPGGSWEKIADRDRERKDVDLWVETWTQTFTLEDCIKECDKYQVPCGPVNSICRHLQGPALRGSREHPAHEGPARRRDRHAERGARASPTRRARSNGSAPPMGAHTDELYKGLLGLTDAEMGKLKDKGVI